MTISAENPHLTLGINICGVTVAGSGPEIEKETCACSDFQDNRFFFFGERTTLSFAFSHHLVVRIERFVSALNDARILH